MQKLRSLHLYLGCIFAPMLLFFAISGIWQTVGAKSDFLKKLSTIHTSRMLKSGGGFTSPFLEWFVILMTISFILTTIVGVVMAVKYGRNQRIAYVCLALGVIVPMLLVLIRVVA